MENFFDCGKLTFLTAEKIIGLVILEANVNVETIKAYILNLEQKIIHLSFLDQTKSALHSVEDLNTNIKRLIRDNNKGLFILNQNYSQKL